MAVHIRLRRIGKNPKKNPHFRVSVFDERQSRDSRSIEQVGYYKPPTGEVKLKLDRIAYWVENGAQCSPTVKSLIKKVKKEAQNAPAASS